MLPHRVLAPCLTTGVRVLTRLQFIHAQVAKWVSAMGFPEHTALQFRLNGVDGRRLLQLDSSALLKLGMRTDVVQQRFLRARCEAVEAADMVRGIGLPAQRSCDVTGSGRNGSDRPGTSKPGTSRTQQAHTLFLHTGISREQAQKLLSAGSMERTHGHMQHSQVGKVGTFLIRHSSRTQGAYVLSIRNTDSIDNHVIKLITSGFEMLGKSFSSLHALVAWFRQPRPELSWYMPLGTHVPISATPPELPQAQPSQLTSTGSVPSVLSDDHDWYSPFSFPTDVASKSERGAMGGADNGSKDTRPKGGSCSRWGNGDNNGTGTSPINGSSGGWDGGDSGARNVGTGTGTGSSKISSSSSSSSRTAPSGAVIVRERACSDSVVHTASRPRANAIGVPRRTRPAKFTSTHHRAVGSSSSSNIGGDSTVVSASGTSPPPEWLVPHIKASVQASQRVLPRPRSQTTVVHGPTASVVVLASNPHYESTEMQPVKSNTPPAVPSTPRPSSTRVKAPSPTFTAGAGFAVPATAVGLPKSPPLRLGASSTLPRHSKENSGKKKKSRWRSTFIPAMKLFGLSRATQGKQSKGVHQEPCGGGTNTSTATGTRGLVPSRSPIRLDIEDPKAVCDAQAAGVSPETVRGLNAKGTTVRITQLLQDRLFVHELQANGDFVAAMHAEVGPPLPRPHHPACESSGQDTAFLQKIGRLHTAAAAMQLLLKLADAFTAVAAEPPAATANANSASHPATNAARPSAINAATAVPHEKSHPWGVVRATASQQRRGSHERNHLTFQKGALLEITTVNNAGMCHGRLLPAGPAGVFRFAEVDVVHRYDGKSVPDTHNYTHSHHTDGTAAGNIGAAANVTGVVPVDGNKSHRCVHRSDSNNSVVVREVIYEATCAMASGTSTSNSLNGTADAADTSDGVVLPLESHHYENVTIRLIACDDTPIDTGGMATYENLVDISV